MTAVAKITVTIHDVNANLKKIIRPQEVEQKQQQEN